MNIKEFIEKSEQLNEIKITEKNPHKYEIQLSGSKKVKAHLEEIVRNLNIDGYDKIIESKKTILVENKDIKDIVQAIQESETYEQIFKKIINNRIIDKDPSRTFYSKNKIRIETCEADEATILQKYIANLITPNDIVITDKGTYSTTITSEKLTRFEECKQYCKDKHKIEKIDEIFNIN